MTPLKAVVIAALIGGGATFAVAQGQVGQGQNPTGDPRPLTPGRTDNPAVKNPVAPPTNPTAAPPKNDPSQPSSASRPIGPPVGDNTAAPGTTKDKADQKKSPN